MKNTCPVILTCVLFLAPGCGKPYTPKEPTAEEIELKKELSVHVESPSTRVAFQHLVN
jgi:hypothetical protein